jgi:acyl carrier protein
MTGQRVSSSQHATSSDRDSLDDAIGDGRVALSDLKETLVGLFGSVLGVPSVNANDDFFSLGGHSLLAFRLVARIKKALQVQVSLDDIFEAPTVGELAALLAERPTSQAGNK